MALRELVFDVAFKGDATAVQKTNKAVDDLEKKSVKVGKGLDSISNKAGSGFGKATDMIKKFGSGIDKIGSAGKKAFGSMKTYMDNVNKSANNLSNNLNNMSSKLGSVASKSAKIGGALTLGVTTPMMMTGKKLMTSAMDFESAMDEVNAISGASAKDMELLNKKAREMGASTKFSAKDSADALKYMAMAGWDTQKMLGGLPGIMNLAAASGEELGTVSDIVTDAMTAFGLSADKSTHFADILAQSSSKSNTSVGLMGETFKYVAPIAGTLGYSAEDTAIAVGLMANAGIKGSQAGTALRASLSNLAKPTKDMQSAMDKLGISLTDSNGTMKPLSTVMDDMRRGFSPLTKEQKAYYASTIFGQEAMSGMLAIVETSKQDYDNLTKSINNAGGTAKKMADIMNDNLKGKIGELGGAVEELGIDMFTILAPSFEKGIEFARSLVENFSKLDDTTKKTVLKFALFAMALGPLITGFSMATGGLSLFTKGLSFISKYNAFLSIGKGATEAGKGIQFITGSFGKLKSGMLAIKTLGFKGAIVQGLGAGKAALAGFTTSILPIIITIGLLIVAGYLLYKNWDMVKSKGVEFINSLQNKFTEFVPTVQGLWENLKTIFLALLPVFSGVLGGIIGGLGSFIGSLVGVVGGIITIFKGITDFLVGVFTGNWQKAWDGILGIFKGVVSTIEAIFGGVMNTINGAINGAKSFFGLGKSTANNTKNSKISGNAHSHSINHANIPMFAKGVENFGGGIAIVGEKGPELVNLPAGSSVKTNSETMDIFRNSNKFLHFKPSESNSYDNSSISNNSERKVIHFSPNITINTTSDKPEEIANVTKSTIRSYFDEWVADEELIS